MNKRRPYKRRANRRITERERKLMARVRMFAISRSQANDKGLTSEVTAPLECIDMVDILPHIKSMEEAGIKVAIATTGDGRFTLRRSPIEQLGQKDLVKKPDLEGYACFRREWQGHVPTATRI